MRLATWESLYRNVKPRHVKYTRSIVSYLDILGFRELEEAKSAGEISRILRILTESVKPHPTDEPVRIQFTKFSDTVIRIVPETRLSVAYFIYELKSILRAQLHVVPVPSFQPEKSKTVSSQISRFTPLLDCWASKLRNCCD
jgi:hypothetical protein